ncbi:MAG: flagellar protein FlaG [Hyphomicrobiales bacterium]
MPQIQTVQQVSALDSVSITFREVSVQPSQQDAEAPQLETVDTPNSVAFENREREIRREFEHDRETAALIFKSIDVSTGEVIQQYPEEARLNLRAYLGNKEEAQRAE